MTNKFTALLILDGFGYSKSTSDNAIRRAGIPNIMALKAKYPHTLLGASGLDVGLPDGQMGNSEVGHLNIGAGRVVYQELTRITKSIADGDFFENPAFIEIMEKCNKLHIMGLVSDGGVHSHNTHLYALLKLAKMRGKRDVFVHCFMDGRDVAPNSGLEFIAALEEEMKSLDSGKIATVSGRYYAMDRDNRWERVSQAYNALVLGEGIGVSCAQEAMSASYECGEFDEFVKPSVVIENGAPVAKIEAGDGVIFFNFRPDRARELTRALTEPDFSGFERQYFPIDFVTMTSYDKTLSHVTVAYPPGSMANTLGEYLSSLDISQFRIAETEKYAHVTFFFNGGVETPNPLEDRVLIPSPKVATYDLQPEMSAYLVAEKAVELIKSGKYQVMILNFANSDMVGHTGIMAAAQSAVRAVDECVAQVVSAILEVGGQCIITADHGNADCMVDPQTGGPFTAHTTNKVPFVLVGGDYVDAKLRDDGKLCDIAPTLLELLGVPKPMEMTGKSIIL